MEVELAGWSMNVGALFKGKRGKAEKAAPRSQETAVVQPLVRGGHRGAAERSSLPRFQTTASDQLNNRAHDRLASIRAKLKHGFMPSQPVADRRMFAGREEILRTIIRAIEDQRLHAVLYGERGIGKTSLLHMLSQAAQEARYIMVYASCGANTTFDEIFRAAAADIPLLFHSGFAPTTSEAERGATLADLLPEGPVTPHKFGDLCSKLTGTRALIILDEFDRCESGAFRRDVAELIKNLSDRLGRVQLVLAGVAADLTELVEHIPSIRRNIFALRVPKLTDAEVLQIVANGEREAGLTFDAAAGTSVVAVALGSPYIANLLCHHAGHFALDQGRSTVLPADVSDAVDRAVTEFQGRIAKPVQRRIRQMFDRGDAETLALAARAALSGDGPFGIPELQASNEIDAKRAQQILQLLSNERLLVQQDESDAGERYEFAEDGLPTFLWISWAKENMRSEVSAARVASR
jgi:Cdc6-like AAA superfamily ATPase